MSIKKQYAICNVVVYTIQIFKGYRFHKRHKSQQKLAIAGQLRAEQCHIFTMMTIVGM